ncbi:metalloprotease [Elizabethkingia argentiflava]|uniref:Metalloprotease n=1 Tax=Elizabethkingia argenteiflava TaxID=2681556 RepID=A0A845PZ58_9FLAO|nr:neutral zinc metallopeptidase [Elizabethkingia argenteiflava]NAW51648.1 metalloprotease [Elizabethkingia argenteiflava]
MKWTNERSNNVEDRRVKAWKGIIVGSGLGAIIVGTFLFFLGGNVSNLFNPESTASNTTKHLFLSKEDKNVKQFVQMIAAWNEATWSQIFKDNKLSYAPPKIVIFEKTTHSDCGSAQVSMGPFYCPSDQTIYVDMNFFEDLQSVYGGQVSEFTIAYVLGHEVGHHIQNLMGTTKKIDQLRKSGRYSTAKMNRISVALELQADFYAGVWAKNNNNRLKGAILEPGDIEAAVNAAQVAGDDNIQRRTYGYINQESFTHGSSAQRVEWFMKGYNTGDIKQGDTFKSLLQ